MQKTMFRCVELEGILKARRFLGDLWHISDPSVLEKNASLLPPADVYSVFTVELPQSFDLGISKLLKTFP